MRSKARRSKRCGIVVSSPAERLKPHAVDVRSPIDPVHGFCNGKDDVRSSYGLPGLPDVEDEDAPHEALIKGFEVVAPVPFKDNDGKLRRKIRAVWWKNDRHLVLTDKTQAFGHYWNVPPIDGHFAPPHPSGHPDLRAWGAEMLRRCPPEGSLPLSGDVACVDFHGITRASADRACIGALRWPEREIVWASGEKTADNATED